MRSASLPANGRQAAPAAPVEAEENEEIHAGPSPLGQIQSRKRNRTRVEFSAVPAGTSGQVTRADGGTVAIEWALEARYGRIRRPLVDWFTREEYEQFSEKQ